MSSHHFFQDSRYSGSRLSATSCNHDAEDGNAAFDSMQDLRQETRELSMANTDSEIAIVAQIRGDREVDESDNKASETAPQWVTGFQLYILIVALFFMCLVLTLDITILATAVPRITDEFHTISDVGWYAAAYMLTNAALTPLSGQLYTFFNVKYTFITFICIFEVGSLLCALASSSKMLVVGRAVGGIGGSGLSSGTFTIIGVASSPEMRPILLGLFMTLFGTGQLAGPLIGGALTQHVTWRWCFWINLPAGALTILFILFVHVPNIQQKRIQWTLQKLVQKLDGVGLLLFAPACVMALLALEWGGLTLPWNSATIIGLFVGAAACTILFVAWEYRQGLDAMIPGPLVRQRLVFTAIVTSLFQAGAVFIVGFYLPLWFQVVMRASPTSSAIYTLPTFVSQVISAVLTTPIMSKIRYLAPFGIGGNAVSTIGYGLMTLFNATTPRGYWIGFQILSGSGRGMSLQTPLQAVQVTVAKEQMATATALVTWAQFFGGAVAVAIAQTAFANLLQTGLARYAPAVSPEAVITAGATDFYKVVPTQDVPAVVTAYNWAITKTYYIAAGLSVVATMLSLGFGSVRIAPKPKTELQGPVPQRRSSSRGYIELQQRGKTSTVTNE